jgi:hypothetical protein
VFPQEVRLVEKPSKINAGEVLVHAFAEFTDAHSATEALNTLQVGLPVTQTYRLALSLCLAAPGHSVFADSSPQGVTHMQRVQSSGPQNCTAC